MPLKIAAKLAEPAEREIPHPNELSLGPEIEFIGEIGGEREIGTPRQRALPLNPLRWPSRSGMVMIEALATGTPVVVTRPGSVPEIVTNGVNGFIRTSERELAGHAARRAGRLDRSVSRRTVAYNFST